MLKQLWPYSLLVILVFFLGAFFAVINHEQMAPREKESIALLDPDIFAPQLKEKYKDIVLVDPEMAPPTIYDQVMEGYRIIMDTQKYAKDYAGDRLNCRNCHFEGGNTMGGQNGSISLVGVSFVYPKYFERAGKTISLGERVNACFERSLNGRPLPLDGKKMQAILAYLNWISTPVRGLKKFPWLGLPKIISNHTPDPNRGQALYEAHCSSCHLSDGSGTHLEIGEKVLNIPPLWGSGSFNKQAGMYKVETMAPFILLNMPLKDPVLSEEQALDISQYIHNQPRS